MKISGHILGVSLSAVNSHILSARRFNLRTTDSHRFNPLRVKVSAIVVVVIKCRARTFVRSFLSPFLFQHLGSVKFIRSSSRDKGKRRERKSQCGLADERPNERYNNRLPLLALSIFVRYFALRNKLKVSP